MRQSFFAAITLFASALTAPISSAQAQDFYASATTTSEPTSPSTGTPAAKAPATTVIIGHVKTAAGALPGAVIKLTKSRQMAVTDADGSFHVTVPAGSGPVQATASYAGFADETVTLDGSANAVTLKTVRIIVVSKGQALKTYQKTARKQAKKSVRKVRRANK